MSRLLIVWCFLSALKPWVRLHTMQFVFHSGTSITVYSLSLWTLCLSLLYTNGRVVYSINLSYISLFDWFDWFVPEYPAISKAPWKSQWIICSEYTSFLSLECDNILYLKNSDNGDRTYLLSWFPATLVFRQVAVHIFHLLCVCFLLIRNLIHKQDENKTLPVTIHQTWEEYYT